MGFVKPEEMNMTQKFGSRRYIQKCAQNEGSNVLKSIKTLIMHNLHMHK